MITGWLRTLVWGAACLPLPKPSPGYPQREVAVTDERGWGRGVALGVGFAAGVAATVAVLATRMRIYHHGECPECHTPLVVSYEPTDDEPCMRRESEVQHPEGSRVGQIVQRAREDPRRPCRTVVIIG